MKTADKTAPQDRTAEVSPLKCFCSVRVKSCRNMRSYPRCRKVKFFNYSAVERKLQLKSFFSKSDSLQCRWAAAQEKAVHFYLPLYENIRRESGVFNFARCPGWQVAPQIERSNILTAACSLLRRAAMLGSFGRRSKAALTSFFYVSDTIALGWLFRECCNGLRGAMMCCKAALFSTTGRRYRQIAVIYVMIGGGCTLYNHMQTRFAEVFVRTSLTDTENTIRILRRVNRGLDNMRR